MYSNMHQDRCQRHHLCPGHSILLHLEHNCYCNCHRYAFLRNIILFPCRLFFDSGAKLHPHAEHIVCFENNS